MTRTFGFPPALGDFTPAFNIGKLSTARREQMERKQLEDRLAAFEEGEVHVAFTKQDQEEAA